MKEILLIIGFLALLLIFGIFYTINKKSNIAYVNQWAANNGHQVKSVEETFFDYGPYWIKDDTDRIYRLDTTQGKVYYFRFRAFWTDVKEYE